MERIKSVYAAQVPAKINLSLSVTGKREGMHTLDMTVFPYDGFVDRVEFCPVRDCSGIEIKEVSATFKNFDKDRFLDFYMPKVLAVAEKLGVCGKLRIFKNVPLGAGLGGSSASVAAAVIAMSDYARDSGKSIALDDGFLLSLGSDVPCMILSKPCIVKGVGEVIVPIDEDLPEVSVFIADGGSDTRACYALYDKMKEENPSVDTSLLPFENNSEKSKYFNDLTAPAVVLNPQIGDLILKLRRDFEFVVMSGSGSAVLGINKKS